MTEEIKIDVKETINKPVMPDIKNITINEPVNILSVKALENINQLIKFNEELIKYRQQKYQFELANKEIAKIKQDIKDKKILKILVPTIGNNFVQVNPNSDDYRKLLNEKVKQFDNSIRGIKEQIHHREDTFHEYMRKTHSYFTSYLNSRGFDVEKVTMDIVSRYKESEKKRAEKMKDAEKTEKPQEVSK